MICNNCNKRLFIDCIKTTDEMLSAVLFGHCKELDQKKEDEMAERGDSTKFDNGKPMWDLLPFDEVEKIVEVLTYGAKKYSENGWKSVPDAPKRYLAAMMRHIKEWKKDPTSVDKESGLKHIAHAACNAIFLIYFTENNK